MRPINGCSALFLATSLLVACGGGASNTPAGASNTTGGSQPVVSTSPPRGTLLQSPPQLLSTVTAPSLLLELNLLTNQQLLSLSGAPVCDILLYHIEYETVGGANEATTASGALMVPTGLGANCTGARPI